MLQTFLFLFYMLYKTNFGLMRQLVRTDWMDKTN